MKITTGATQKDAQILDLRTGRKPRPILHYNVDYDSTRPKETIRQFVGDIQNMISRFEGNKLRVIEIENELADLCHYIEIAPYQTGPKGYRLYRKMAELRRERRACKNENDLLQPIYEYFHATEVLNRLSTVQGECAKVKFAIDARSYTVRTDILEEVFEKTDKEGEPTDTVLAPAGEYADQPVTSDLAAREILKAAT